MKILKTIFIFVICFLPLTLHTNAAEVTVGDETISIPSPSGFTEISSISPETVQLFEDMCPPTNRLLSSFVSQEDAGRLLQGEAAVLDKYMVVQSFKKLEAFSLTKYQFKVTRTTIRSQYESLFKEKSELIDKIMGQAGQAISKRVDADVAFNIGDIVPLGIDSETASSIVWSQLAKYSVELAGDTVEYVVAGTACTLLVKGKVIYLYVYKTYNDKSDLDWTRKTSRSWTDSILSANNITSPLSSGRIVPEGTAIGSITNELLAGQWESYNTKSHPKSEGLDISIEYPSSWQAEEGIRPHIVQKFTERITGGMSVSCMLIIQELPTWAGLFLKGEIAEDMLSEGFRDMIPPNAQFIDGSPTKIDGEPSAWVKFYNEAERVGIRIGSYSLTYFVFYEGKMFAVECFLGGLAEDKELIEDAFNSYLPVFQRMGGSIVINEKWAETGKVTWDSVLRNIFGEYWLIMLVLSAIFTWAIGLALPLLIRFVIARRPLSRGLSITFVVLFLFINIVIFTALGSESKTHAALFLVASASYAILRKGSRKWKAKEQQANKPDPPEVEENCGRVDDTERGTSISQLIEKELDKKVHQVYQPNLHKNSQKADYIKGNEVKESERANEIGGTGQSDTLAKKMEQVRSPIDHERSEDVRVSPIIPEERVAQEQDDTAQVAVNRNDAAESLRKLKPPPDSGTNPTVLGRLEECANCDRIIGKLEKSYDFKGHVVCIQCYKRLV